MTGSPDKAVMAVIAVGVAVWLVYRLYVWIQRTETAGTIPLNREIAPHPALKLLEDAGYEVIGGRLKIPLSFRIDGREALYSRLFIDYIAAAEDGGWYPVILARPRKAVEWTGSGLRDALLPYMLLYPDSAGILYVNTAEETVRAIAFGRDDGESD
ncbi:hypothetical protein [Paenibacillus glufosinatiresistens]|uniref:hypothetical protein n=1 Tax=Paenibacillus glufosinatiresistens TaxID=3070657 RepID=UPI00286DBD95|nr:hypothetical protein [Paenibacillus sp. YX.27]